MSIDKRKSSKHKAEQKAVEVFFSYSHKDEELRDELARHLSSLKRQGLISQWHDRKITPGVAWKDEIDGHLKKADLILLLVSSDFIASEYCYGIELTQAITHHERGDTKVIPIILRPTDWQGTPFSKLQALPKNGKPVTSWNNRDEAFLNITAGVRSVVESLHLNNILTPSSSFAKEENKVTENAEKISAKQKLIETTDGSNQISFPTTQHSDLGIIRLKILSEHKTPVKWISFTNDGTLLASASSFLWFTNGSLRLWQVNLEKQIRVLDEGTDYNSISFSGDGEYLISGNPNNCWKWKVSTGARLPDFRDHESQQTILSKDGSLLVRILNSRKNIELINFHTGKIRHLIKFPGKNDSFSDILLSPNGELLAATSIRTIHIYNVDQGKLTNTIRVSNEESGFYSMRFSPDNLLLATGQSGLVRLWNTSDGTILRELEYDASDRSRLHNINSLSFSPDGQFLAGSVYKLILLWRVSDGKVIQILEGHSKDINQIAFSPVDTILASASNDKTIRLWYLKKIADF